MRDHKNKILFRLKQLGPGLLFAGAAIGVSHFVQSTTAGAMYGWGLILAVILANLMKYPFFEFGPRYTLATGESLLTGYKRLGNWALGIILFITVGTMFTIQAAVTIVTAGILATFFDVEISMTGWSAILLIICMLILMIGKYNLLDSLIKYVIIILAVSTLAAFILAFQNPHPSLSESYGSFEWDAVGIIFLIALIGWMPAPLDLSVWNSIWIMEKQKKMGSKMSMKDGLFDFNVGYIGTSILALCFLGLGALVVYGSGDELPSSAAGYATKLIEIYTGNLGSWSFWIISVAAFTAMFSTTLTCLDAFPRVLGEIFRIWKGFPSTDKGPQPIDMEIEQPVSLAQQGSDNNVIKHNYWIWIIIVASGTLILLSFLGGQMGLMVKIATILSFMAAPVFAWINYRLITSQFMPNAHKPGLILRILSWSGILFLSGFFILYIIVVYSAQ